MKDLLSTLLAAACLIGASGTGASAPSLASLQLMLLDQGLEAGGREREQTWRENDGWDGRLDG